MTTLSQDRLIRKEVALGTIRELPRPENHIGLMIAPWKEVQSDDVIFAYLPPDTDGLAPARAEDAESELAQKDDTVGVGRASIIDWAVKDHYSASDVSRFREYRRLAEIAAGGNFPLTVSSMTEDFQAKLARDERRRRRKLDNRIEWMIFQALETSHIAYNDGRIVFDVDFGRPANQTDEAPASSVEWDVNDGTHDPINDLLAVQEFMYDTYYVKMDRVIMSEKAIRYMANSAKFAQRAGLYHVVGGSPANADPNYVIDGWGAEAVRRIVEQQTGLKIIPYDSIYRTRAIGSTSFVNNRFMSENVAIFLPRASDMEEITQDSEIGFASTLTAPHPEGNWQSGFYEWEKSDVDPWGHDRGTGVKAFPVFPHLEYTYTLKLWT